MTRPRLRIGSELLPLCLILASLAGTSFLIVSMHRRVARQSQRKRAPAVVIPPVVAAPTVQSPVQLPPTPVPPPPEPTPAPPVEDPTRTALVRLGAEEADQLLEAQAADRRAEALERSTKAALAESQRWKRREQVVRSQVETITDRTQALEQEVDALALERDVLAHELEASKAALTKARTRSSFAVLPNRAPNGTWRRPIVIECKNGTATLQPKGPSFNLLDLSALLGAHSSPLLLAVARELARIQGTTGPDGAPTVPYIFFVVRPDGIRPYYDARARLESLGIAFGYELVDQDMEIDFPDLDHPEEWDGSPPLSKFPDLAKTDEPHPRSGGRGGKGQSPDDFRWPTGLPRGGSSEGSGSPLEGNRRLALGGRNGLGLGRQFGDRGIPSAPGGIPGLDRSGGIAGESQRSASSGSRAGGTTEPPGMLPSRGGALDSPGMPPAPGGTFASAGGPPGAFDASGRSGVTTGRSNPGTGTEVPGGASPPGRDRPEIRDLGERVPSTSPIPDDVSTLDGVSLMGRKPGEGAPFRPRGLLPGEPGAPPEEASLDLARTTERQNANPGSSGGGSSSGASGSNGGTSASGGAAGGSPGGQASGRAGGQGNSSSPTHSRGPLRIEVPMEIVVACGPNGVVIHPGGYSLSSKVLRGKEPIFTKSLQTIVRLRQQVDPMIRPQPSIKFLVEPGGGETYRQVRRQTVLSGINWPTVLQVADTRVLDFLPRERF